MSMKQTGTLRKGTAAIAVSSLWLILSLVLSSPSAWGERLRTLKVGKEGDFMAAPCIRLGSDERISINFDEWSDDYSDLQYRLIHCNSDWKPSRLLESEYLDGFNIADLDDYAYSSNTFVHYVNYQLFLPSGNMNPLVSGNYIVEIFERDDPDTIIGEARFSIAEQTAEVRGGSSAQTDRGFKTEWQQLDLEVIPTDISISDPYTDLTVVITQNGAPESERRIHSPSRVDGKKVIYSHLPELIFKAGNEFRRFESIRTNYNDMNVDSVRYIGKNYHVWLTPDRERATSEYSYDETQHGRFLVREYSSTDSNLGADYVTVHFRLEEPEVLGADVYVEGEFTGYNLNESTRMRYDYGSGAYVLEMPLKQGSYNYRYVAVPRNGGKPESDVIEGNKYETRNEYRVQVWYKPPGARAERLISDVLLR